MGEKKFRLTALAKMLSEQPWCVYCGGDTPGETLDHMPPVTIFDSRHRPKGLEFVSCTACNSGGRRDDQVAGLLSRMFPDSEIGITDDDLKQAFSGIGNNHPGLLEEMQPRPRQMTELRKKGMFGVHALNASGPLVNRAMEAFAARMGLALHFHSTARIVPRVGGVGVKWMTNMQLFEHGLPADLMSLLGPPRTLRAGKFSVGSQFAFSGVVADTKTLTAHVATFRQSFGIIVFVAEDLEQLGDWREAKIYRPGFLKAVP